MQRPMPLNNPHDLPSPPTCSICREGRVRGTVLALCTKCHRYSHLQCREIPPDPTYALARCPDCTIAYRRTSQTSNVPVPQPAFPPQATIPPQPRQQQQYQTSTTNIPANILPQYTSYPQLSPPYPPFPAVSAPFTTNGTVNPALLNIDQTLHTQAGQPGFEIRRLARVMQATPATQPGIIQIAQRPPPPPTAAFLIGLTNNPLSRPPCRHPLGVTCDLCMPFGWPR